MVDGKIIMPIQAMADLIWSGVPQRYPRLRFVIVEGGVGWVASVLRFMDHWWTDHHLWMEPKLNEPPSFYFTLQSRPNPTSRTKREYWSLCDSNESTSRCN